MSLIEKISQTVNEYGRQQPTTTGEALIALTTVIIEVIIATEKQVGQVDNLPEQMVQACLSAGLRKGRELNAAEAVKKN
jgi:hypothetical protein